MSFHLAGIIPVAGSKLDFNFPWHDCMMPIARDYLAIERAVLECAYAGCETIWIVCNDDMQPLIRYRLGDYVNDPVWVYRHYEYDKSEKKKLIPIQYVPVHPRDRNKRDCYGWSILYGAKIADKISKGLSTWIRPDRFYVAFPYGVYPHWFPRSHRPAISAAKEAKVLYRFEDKTIMDGEYLGFTFNYSDLEQFMREVKEKSSGLFKENTRERIPIGERYSYRFFTLDKVFDTIDTSNVTYIDVEKYYRIDSWDLYCDYMEKEAKTFYPIPRSLINGAEINPVGVDE
jgi:hypothetical protein